MSLGVRFYFVLLLAAVLGWLWASEQALFSFAKSVHWLGLIGVISLYLCTHLLRMSRLALLTLDERDRAFGLISAHALTAFPGSFLPFKFGEILRLGAFFHVFGGRRKALAVWLSERFGDIVVIAGFILSLHLFGVSIPRNMQVIFLVFVLMSITGLVGLFAVAKIFVYLNRHLVLTSHSSRGLFLLRTSYALRRLELEIYKSVEGRFSGFLLLSVLIWVLEAIALALFISLYSIERPDFASLFVSGLLASLPGGSIGNSSAFGLYQSFTLVVLSLIFLAVIYMAVRLESVRSK